MIMKLPCKQNQNDKSTVFQQRVPKCVSKAAFKSDLYRQICTGTALEEKFKRKKKSFPFLQSVGSKDLHHPHACVVNTRETTASKGNQHL